MVRIAFQGEHGAYSELACARFFGSGRETVPCPSLKDVFLQVEDDRSDFGIVPVENSTAGDVYETLDLLFDFSLHVCGEVYMRIIHCLIGQPGTRLGNIMKVYSHLQALAQCNAFLERIKAEKIAVYDTAGAVAMVKNSGRKDEAAIASESAAEIYGLEIIQKGIETDKTNTTRFFIISKQSADITGRMKTSIIFSAKDRPGALYDCLGGFARNSINLTKLVSRPVKNAKWKYLFYMDFLGGLEEKAVKAALEKLGQHAEFVRVLGSYPAGTDD